MGVSHTRGDLNVQGNLIVDGNLTVGGTTSSGSSITFGDDLAMADGKKIFWEDITKKYVTGSGNNLSLYAVGNITANAAGLSLSGTTVGLAGALTLVGAITHSGASLSSNTSGNITLAAGGTVAISGASASANQVRITASGSHSGYGINVNTTNSAIILDANGTYGDVYIEATRNFQVDADEAYIAADTNVSGALACSGSVGGTHFEGLSAEIFNSDFTENAGAFDTSTVAFYFDDTVTDSGAVTIAAMENGVLKLASTSSTAGTASVIYTGAAQFDNDLSWVIEARVKLNTVTNTNMRFGMYLDANDHILFAKNVSYANPNNIYIVTANNGSTTATDGNITMANNTWYTLRIEVFPDDTFRMYVNGSALTPSSSNTIRDVNFKPYIYVGTSAAQNSELYVDYLRVWQRRS